MEFIGAYEFSLMLELKLWQNNNDCLLGNNKDKLCTYNFIQNTDILITLLLL